MSIDDATLDDEDAAEEAALEAGLAYAERIEQAGDYARELLVARARRDQGTARARTFIVRQLNRKAEFTDEDWGRLTSAQAKQLLEMLQPPKDDVEGVGAPADSAADPLA